MEISGTYTLYAPRERVWAYLLDPAVLLRTIPGGEKLEQDGEDRFRGRIHVGVAAVKGVYDGTLQVVDRVEPEHFKMIADGSGARGVMHGEGIVSLEARGPTTTFVTYQGQAQLGGAVASVGMRVAGGAARMLINQFFARMADALAETEHGAIAQGQANVTHVTADAAAPRESAVTVGSQTQWGSGVPEAVPLPSERMPTEATRIELQEPPPVTPAATAAHVTLTAPVRPAQPGALTRFIRRSGLSDGSSESEQRIARRLLVAGAGTAVATVVAIVALVTGWRRNR